MGGREPAPAARAPPARPRLGRGLSPPNALGPRAPPAPQRFRLPQARGPGLAEAGARARRDLRGAGRPDRLLPGVCPGPDLERPGLLASRPRPVRPARGAGPDARADALARRGDLA